MKRVPPSTRTLSGFTASPPAGGGRHLGRHELLADALVQAGLRGLEPGEELCGLGEGPPAVRRVHLAGGVLELAAHERPALVDAAQEVVLQVLAARLEDDRPLAVAVAVDAHVLVV